MARKQAQFATKLEMSQTGLFDGSRNASSPAVTAFLDNSDPGHTLSQYLQQAVPAAQKLCVCTGYVSVEGLQFLADWQDQMGPQGEAQLLIGMPH